ncbi:glycosyltransferase [Azospirillum sp. SYSU D00513]|uniref:CgeB family protein n=1 Tax=Azospirillum sp. SYSU D00513 TaxID=2812561 RepID=UPI001A9645D6|nr:glycosyltransferase [Azospirillum sp. SYSU D00513]
MAGLDIAFYGSSLVSAYWNGAATYYRGIIRALAARGHRVTFYEPDAYERQKHRDIADPPWAKVVVYPATQEGLNRALEMGRGSDVVVKASGVGVFDDELAEGVLSIRRPGGLAIYWDVDAPATLAELDANPSAVLRRVIPDYDMVLTYGGGPPVVDAFTALGARMCVPVYNALDPDTHHPVPYDERFDTDLTFLGNRLPDREERVEQFFLDAASRLPDRRFLLAGNGWHDKAGVPANVRTIGHVYTADHNALNCSGLAVLNISRESMARMGYSPATRVFEAAGAGACLITDHWVGIEMFLEPDVEVLVARDGAEVAEHVASLTKERARDIGQAALKRVLADHTYDSRAVLVEKLLTGADASVKEGV